jgi:hypothetical protein
MFKAYDLHNNFCNSVRDRSVINISALIQQKQQRQGQDKNQVAISAEQQAQEVKVKEASSGLTV